MTKFESQLMNIVINKEITQLLNEINDVFKSDVSNESKLNYVSYNVHVAQALQKLKNRNCKGSDETLSEISLINYINSKATPFISELENL